MAIPIPSAESALLNFLFPPPPSLFISAMSFISLVSLAGAGFEEIKGKHLQYSKFSNVYHSKNKIQLSSKLGMLLLYTPALLAGAASFLVSPHEGLRSTFLQCALTLHFFKRVLEVLFVHKYSGTMVLDSAILIMLGYFLSTATMLYAQHLALGLPEPAIDLTNLGLVLFLIGISGNLYHHYLLSKLRRGSGGKEYKIPEGGLFGLVICPHYLFEIIGFYGISFISQTLYAFSFTLGTTFYLIGRSIATRRWYRTKFEDFPQHVKALVPFVI